MQARQGVTVRTERCQGCGGEELPYRLAYLTDAGGGERAFHPQCLVTDTRASAASLGPAA